MARLTINNHPVRIDMPAQAPLLFALRDAMNLTGTKYGCGVGDCGACTVIVDGGALRSCLITLGECEGRTITTIEGLSEDRSHPVQRAMVAEQAVQCGFCTPGIVMAAAALLKSNPRPQDTEIIEAIPNLCRCGVYPRLVRAIRRAANEAPEAAPASGEPAAPADALTPNQPSFGD